MPHLEVEDTSLYYETFGSGPMLLCITGAIGQVEPWRGLAEHLKESFQGVSPSAYTIRFCFQLSAW